MFSLIARRGECLAGELAAPFDIAQPTASKHLRVLERARLVQRTVRGREHRFRIRRESIREAEDWIADQRRFWESALNLLGDFLKETRSCDEGEQT